MMLVSVTWYVLRILERLRVGEHKGSAWAQGTKSCGSNGSIWFYEAGHLLLRLPGGLVRPTERTNELGSYYLF